MSSEPKENEQHPFLKYSDDPTISEPEPNRRYPHGEASRNKLFSHGLVFLVTSLLWMMAIFVFSSPSTPWKSTTHIGDRHNITSHARLVTCGNTTEEAKAAGCTYDVLLNCWVPAQCVDDEFILEYQDDESWGAYADKNMTKKLTPQEMSEMDHYYTSVRDHVNHCAVMWKKQFWAMFEETSNFDTVIASPGHTDHCAQYLMDAPESNWSEPTTVERGFAGCWIRE